MVDQASIFHLTGAVHKSECISLCPGDKEYNRKNR
jgi:hypothetical protein